MEYEATLETRARKARRRWAHSLYETSSPSGPLTGAGQAQTVLIGQHESAQFGFGPVDAIFRFLIRPRRRNLWFTDMVAWCLEARLAQPANSMPVVKFFLFLASCLSNQFALPGKRYAVRP